MNNANGKQGLGIIDYRNILGAIQEFHNKDFSNYSFTPLKRRFEHVIDLHNMASPNDLVAKLRDDEAFFPVFLHEISIPETEMFRDPNAWRELRDGVLVLALRDPEFRIWLPEATSGEELFTLCIILEELKLLDKAKVLATSMSLKNLERIQKGVFSAKSLEVNMANYKRYKGNFKFEKYYTEAGNEIVMDPELVKHVEFQAHDLCRDEPPSKLKLVLLRNKLIYYNKRLEMDVLRNVQKGMLPGAYLVLGIQENLECCNADKRFVLVNKSESIYKKAFL